MKKLLLCFLLCLPCWVTAQIYLEPTIYLPTPGNSDGALKVEIMGYSGSVNYEINDPFGSGAVVYSDSMGNLGGSGTIPLLLVHASDVVTGDTVSSLVIYGLSDALAELDFNSVLASATSTSCDGSFSINHTFNQGVVSDYDYYIAPIGITPSTTTPYSNPAWNNLCPGQYVSGISLNSNPLIEIQVDIESLTPIQSNPSYSASVFSTISDNSNCTAVSAAIVNGTTPPYQYSWDGGPFTSVDTLSSVCPGMHVLKIVDSANDTLGMNFGVVDSTQFYQNPSGIGNSPIIDTISFNTQNCSFDYNQSVDSVSMTYFEEIDTNTIYFEMDIWQSGALVQAADTVSCNFTSNGNNLFSLTLYCGLKAAGQKIFQIMDYINPSILSLNGKHLSSNVSLYPNPSNGAIFIEMEGFKQARLYTITGKKLANFETTDLGLGHLNSGSYIVIIEDIHGNIVSKRVLLQ